MRRKSAKDSEERDAESVLDELYATAPPRFVSRREELAARARTEGRAADARRIRAARRPTLAAWAANLLLHSRPEESRRFLDLGQELREAYRTLDAAEIKELSKQRGSVVASLSRQAAELARDAGHRLSDAAQQDVASTLHAVLADEDAADQWATGRLESALTPPAEFPPSGVTGTAGARPKSARSKGAAQRSRAGTGTDAGKRPAGAKDELAERRRQKQERRAQEAREAAEAADEQLRERHAEHRDADEALQQARDRHEEARRQMTAAEEQLRQAQEELRRADRAERDAEERSREAADAVAGAEQAARAAAREAERLRGGSRT
ncbi:hypothetical protein ACH4D5_20565 [Streptomyces sp. NPDC018029]|uniref:hypothetical protein n=1 Tax=Streptomyces sp. NPDC018029 TaxID=3365032 RepID=UPI0037905B9D